MRRRKNTRLCRINMRQDLRRKVILILVWDGSTIRSIDLDREIPGPHAEEVARLIEPTYLRGYLEGRLLETGRAMLRNRAATKGYRQIQAILHAQPVTPPMGTARQYAEQLLCLQQRS